MDSFNIHKKIQVFLLLLSIILWVNLSDAKTLDEDKDSGYFKSSIQSIPQVIQVEMKKYTWHPGCPVALDQLAYVQLNYWGFDNETHDGVLIVHKELANEVVDLFKKLYEHHYPIQSLKPMDAFHGNDVAAMAANNTSSFNCREVTNQPGIFSQHSYGRALDINPLLNPYVHGKSVLPSAGRKFLNRNTFYPGKIIKNDFVSRLFSQQGWDWGAGWYDAQDYQHFEKRANGKKRNPLGTHLS